MEPPLKKPKLDFIYGEFSGESSKIKVLVNNRDEGVFTWKVEDNIKLYQSGVPFDTDLWHKIKCANCKHAFYICDYQTPCWNCKSICCPECEYYYIDAFDELQKIPGHDWRFFYNGNFSYPTIGSNCCICGVPVDQFKKFYDYSQLPSEILAIITNCIYSPEMIEELSLSMGDYLERRRTSVNFALSCKRIHRVVKDARGVS